MKKPPQPQTSLRKSPKQKRSQELVDAVIVAATRILEKTGIDALTTNKVAEKAGVSIGSLYQYFPNKDAIFAKLIERQMDENAQRFQAAILAHKNQDVHTVIDALINEVVDLFFVKKEFIKTLFSEVPKLKKTRDVLYRRNKMLIIFIQFLNEYKDLLHDPEKIEQSVYVVAHSVAGVMQTAVLEDFASYSQEILRQELKTLIVRYLLKPT